jgi:uncharacterized membrane-anchored protein
MNRIATRTWARAVLFAGFMLVAPAARADGPAPPPMTREDVAAAMRGPAKQTGLADGAVQLYTPAGVEFIPANEVPPLLQKGDAAAPPGTVLGGLAPTGAKPGAKDYRLTVISYQQIGHVPESGQADLSSMTFLDSVKAARPTDSVESFLAPPLYTSNGHVLTWTEQRTATGGAEARAEQRFLGRDAVIGLTTIGRADQALPIAAAQPGLAQMIVFSPGYSYIDYVAGTHKASDYDLPALITGKPNAVAMAAAPAPAAPSMFANLPDPPGGWAPYLALGGLAVASVGFLAIRSRRTPAIDDDIPSDQA